MTIPQFPKSSPAARPLKYLLWAILLCTLAGPLFHIQHYLSLSRHAITSGFVWTLLTYPFTYPGAAPLLDLLLHLGFSLALLWIFGNFLIERIGSKRFCALFFGATLLAGLLAAASSFLFRPISLATPSPPLLALCSAWFILHSNEERFLRKPIWLFSFLVGGNLLIDAISQQWILLIADATGALFGYFFCLIAEKTGSPFSFLRPLEKGILRSLEKRGKAKNVAEHKIIDFATGAPKLSDEEFMDAMLARISLYGEKVLTPEEKKRMQRISATRTSQPPLA